MEGPREQVRTGLGSAASQHPSGQPPPKTIPFQVLQFPGGVGVLSASGDGCLMEVVLVVKKPSAKRETQET